MKSGRSVQSNKGNMSPYAKEFKHPIPPDKRALITTRLCVKELSRKELEDKFYVTYDENYLIKQENRYYREKIKQLATKLIRLSKSSKYKKPNLFHSTDDVRFNFKKLSDQNVRLKDLLENIILKHNIDTHLILEIESMTDNQTERVSNSTPELRTSRQKIVTPTDVSKSDKKLNLNSRQSSIESKGSNNAESVKSFSKNSSSSSHSNQLQIDKTVLEDQIKFLDNELSSLKHKHTDILEVNRELSEEIKGLNRKIAEIEINVKRAENMKIMDLKKLIRNTRGEIKTITASREAIMVQSNNVLQRERERVVELESRLNTDVENIFHLKQKAQSSETSQKFVGQLQKNVRDLENERELLLKEKESFQNLLSSHEICSICVRRKNEKSNQFDYDEIEKILENEKSQTEALLNSQRELLEKVKTLQNENDQLLIELDGKRYESQMLLDKKLELEQKILTISTKFMSELTQYQQQTCDTNDINNLTVENQWTNKSRC